MNCILLNGETRVESHTKTEPEKTRVYAQKNTVEEFHIRHGLHHLPTEVIYPDKKMALLQGRFDM
jgi:hypothetical protein